MFLVQVVQGKKVQQTVGPMGEREAKAHAQRIADALGSKGSVFLLPLKPNEGGGHASHPSVSIDAHDANIDAARYPSIFSDTNDDGLPDIDDAFGPLRHEGPAIQTEETRLSGVFSTILKVRQAYQKQVETFLAELASEFPGRPVSGRAKTPYSLIQKLLRSYVLDPTDPKAKFKRATLKDDNGKEIKDANGKPIEGDALMLKDFAGTSIYAKNKRDLDQIVQYIDTHYGGVNQIEKEDKYAEEDEKPMGERKGYVAVHYIFLRDGVPVELQVKTERMAHLGDASHTPMKNKTLDIPKYMEWVNLVRRADLGDSAAAAQVDPMLTSPAGIEEIASQITLRRNPSSRARWSDNDYADLADFTENPHRGHVEAEWRHNPASSAMMAAGRAALPVLHRLAASPAAQKLAAHAAGRIGMRTNRSVQTDDGEVEVDPLPFGPDRYFIGGVDVPLGMIQPIRARKKGIVNANIFMRQAYDGLVDRRKPVTLVEVGDPHDKKNRYRLLDGNSTYANAAMSGWPTIRATVVDELPEGMRPNPKDPFAAVHRAIEKEVARYTDEGGPFAMRRLVDAAYRVEEKHRTLTGETLPVESVHAEIIAAEERARVLRRERSSIELRRLKEEEREENRLRYPSLYGNPSAAADRKILESSAMRDWVYLGKASPEIADFLAEQDVNPDMPHTIRRYDVYLAMVKKLPQ